MARGVNKVILLGFLGRDPESRPLPSGANVVNFSIATTEVWREKGSETASPHTEWHRIVVFGRLGDIATQLLRKGSQVYIEGSLRTRQWQDKAGQARSSTEIVAKELQVVGASSEAPEMAKREDDIPW